MADLDTILNNLTQSLVTTKQGFPATAHSNPDGISLLDLKNDVFLSYLHHLSFLILCRIRGVQLSGTSSDEKIASATVQKLAELRVWLERGVKPAETKLKYQIDKVLRAAKTHERDEERRKKAEVESDGSSEDDSNAEDEGEEDDEDAMMEDGRRLPTTTDYDSDELTASVNAKLRQKNTSSLTTTADDLSFRPNPSMLTKPSSTGLATASTAEKQDGIYRPPKINPTALPSMTTDDPDSRKRDRAERVQRSHAVDEYIASEYSTAPLPMPSIGSTISDFGRKTTTQRQRDKEAERTTYEESNFVRLPKLSKKEEQRQRKAGGGRGGDNWGGESWADVTKGMGLDRIEKLTAKRGGMDNILARSRKRDADDGGGGGGGDRRAARDVGERFEKRRKVLAGNKRR